MTKPVVEAPQKANTSKKSVIPPAPEPTKMENILNTFVSEVDAQRSSMHFNGDCLPESLAAEARLNKLTCETTLNEKMDQFDL